MPQILFSPVDVYAAFVLRALLPIRMSKISFGQPICTFAVSAFFCFGLFWENAFCVPSHDLHSRRFVRLVSGCVFVVEFFEFVFKVVDVRFVSERIDVGYVSSSETSALLRRTT